MSSPDEMLWQIAILEDYLDFHFRAARRVRADQRLLRETLEIAAHELGKDVRLLRALLASFGPRRPPAISKAVWRALKARIRQANEQARAAEDFARQEKEGTDVHVRQPQRR